MTSTGRVIEMRAARQASARWLAPLMQSLLDIILIGAAFALAYWIRYSLQLGPAIQSYIPFTRYEPLMTILIGVTMAVLFTKGAYRLRLSNGPLDEIATVFSAATISVAAIVVITALTHRYEYSRGVIIYVWALMIVLMVLGRTVFRAAQGFCHRRGWGVRRLLVVGSTERARMLMQSVMSRPDLGFLPVGFVDRAGTPLSDFGRFPALGAVTDIPALIATHRIDEIVVGLPAAAHEDTLHIVGLCESAGVGVRLIPDLFETSLSHVHVDDLGGIPLVSLQERPLRHLEHSLKRLMDVAISAVLLVLTLPLAVLVGILIKLDSPGPVLHRQERVGLGGQRFRCLKFRTMHDGAEAMHLDLQARNGQLGPTFKMRDDPRLTSVGRRLRRWSLDEVPQLWNVLRGEMSLVGPRPPLPLEVARYDARHRRRLDVKPGMTGIWQVSGRSDLHFEEMVTMDIYYVENWSIGLDIRILVRTVVAVLARHGAY